MAPLQEVAETSDVFIPEDKNLRSRFIYISKIVILSVIVLVSVGIISVTREEEHEFHQMSVTSNDPWFLKVHTEGHSTSYKLMLEGAFDVDINLNASYGLLYICLQHISKSGLCVSDLWTLSILDPRKAHKNTSEFSHYFDLQSNIGEPLLLAINVTSEVPVTLSASIDGASSLTPYTTALSIGILIFLYVMLIFEIVHRTLASLVTACVSIAVLSLLDQRPSLEDLVSWIDVETVSLMFSMMVMVAILCDTGIFDCMAVWTYRLAKGDVWMLITLLCLITAFISAFLDNVTTILLITPVTIRLCEVMNIHPKHVLITLVLFTNVGGLATGIGDPPNVLIISNQKLNEQGVTFINYTLHMSIGIIITTAVTYVFIRKVMGNMVNKEFEEPMEITKIEHEINVWKRTASSVSVYAQEELTVKNKLEKKVDSLQAHANKLKTRRNELRSMGEDFDTNLKVLQEQYRITDWPKLTMAGSVLLLEIMLFFASSIPQVKISIGWIALLCTVLLLVLTDLEELDLLLSRVEWSTLTFFAALFVIIESLTKLGLPAQLGELTEQFIMSVPIATRLPVALLFVLWLSAIIAAFVDNIAFTTVMIKVLGHLGDGGKIGIPVQPLVWALAFGCLGGNGTLIGAAANVVCAGVAQQHGYRFTFMEFFKIGFPTMLVTVVIATIYLLVCHVAFGWNG